MFGKRLYVHNALCHSVCGNSSVFVAAYLHSLVFGRPEEDDFAQEYFENHSLMFYQNRFVELTQILLQAKEQLETLEEVDDPEDVSVDNFYKVLTEAKNTRLAAFISKDPATAAYKLHLRILWNWKQDEHFQLNVLKNLKKPMPQGTPEWKHTQRGVTFTLQDLSMFLENDFADLLVNTFLDQPLKQEMQDLAEYIAENKQDSVDFLFEDYRKGVSNKEITANLREIGKEFLSNYALDYIKFSKELEVFFSLLLLKTCSENLLQLNLKKEKKRFKTYKMFNKDQHTKKQKNV